MHYIAYILLLSWYQVCHQFTTHSTQTVKPQSWTLSVTHKCHCNCADCLYQALHARSWTGESRNINCSVFRYHTANPPYPFETLDRALTRNANLKAWKDFRQECSKPETLLLGPGPCIHRSGYKATSLTDTGEKQSNELAQMRPIKNEHRCKASMHTKPALTCCSWFQVRKEMKSTRMWSIL